MAHPARTHLAPDQSSRINGPPSVQPPCRGVHAFFGCIAYVREGSRSLSGKPVEFWKFGEGRLARRFGDS